MFVIGKIINPSPIFSNKSPINEITIYKVPIGKMIKLLKKERN